MARDLFVQNDDGSFSPATEQDVLLQPCVSKHFTTSIRANRRHAASQAIRAMSAAVEAQMARIVTAEADAPEQKETH